MKNNVVDVIMITYNHEKYIEKSVRSVLNQETNFDFSIIIGEDCSTDSTRDILLKLKKEYPDKIHLVLHDENIGSKNNLKSVEEKCKSSYIAILEGDDFWTDNKKLQKQIDFLEKNKKFSASVHDILVIDEFEKPILNSYHDKLYSKEIIYNIDEFEKGLLPGQSGTMVCRNYLVEMSKKDREAYYSAKSNGDLRRVSALILKNPIFRFSSQMSCYRYVVKNGSSWNASIYGKNLTFENFKSYEQLENMMSVLSGQQIRLFTVKQNFGFSALKYLVKKPNKENFSIFISIYVNVKEDFWKNLFRKIWFKRGNHERKQRV